MIFIYLTALNRKEEIQEFTFGGPDIDVCLCLPSTLVKAGSQLISVKLILCEGNTMYLPVDAFDGGSMEGDLQALQQEWEEILFENK